MCELMGLSFARPISADFSIREFARRGTDNADGWGLAWYPDRAAAIVKEPLGWGQTPYATFLQGYPALRSALYIAHVRRKTTGSGEPTYADTHPFLRELGGTDFCFAHNGTLRGDIWELPLGRFMPVGRTDSERAFCYLMEAVAGRSGGLATSADWTWLHARCQQLNERGQFNCLLTDGRHLFCYHDRTGYKGLTFRKLHLRDGETRQFGDAEVQLDLSEAGINHGFVIATQPLSPNGWHAFLPGELLVLEAGIVRQSSHRSPGDAVFTPPREL